MLDADVKQLLEKLRSQAVKATEQHSSLAVSVAHLSAAPQVNDAKAGRLQAMLDDVGARTDMEAFSADYIQSRLNFQPGQTEDIHGFLLNAPPRPAADVAASPMVQEDESTPMRLKLKLKPDESAKRPSSAPSTGMVGKIMLKRTKR
ncbi:uncharacterized protein MONBRDRAFT_32878 [Monosiga brevicollis MX1]|uniref:Uncharacterized protein n=1 Tax=Monosiga brevicollis TaxID=81824 RepID=A9V288_MONBE|nr:uncharacterized protein MONBRDRAFT_32878 [Monosiga brevicollis MX1]EDQ88334.1 predicted protein [Monosiga brevicollis MX1]|eukprot:XP_001746927.1 hypothetical protein [Monosiga brevicollis MX1]